MIGRALGTALGALLLTCGAVVLGYRGYQAYLEWLVAGSPQPDNQPAPSTADAAQEARGAQP